MLVQLKKYLAAITIIGIFSVSCKKDIQDSSSTNQTPDLSTKINSSVSGFVTDENNNAVLGASVKFGTSVATTDKFGFFEIKNTAVVKSAAMVTVIKPGYFNAIKTYAATENKAAFFRMKLIPKIIAGTINASSGGNVTLGSGLIISLPSNGVVNAATNASYTGNINVAAFWINPEATDLTEIMPGDLRGLDEGGSMKGLTTYGMAAVELTGSSGELLQIAGGKKATITMPLSSFLSSAAPASIPLWYFDENNGLWKQDGTATRTGNSYVGEVSHFSYWNCDLPNAIVPLTFTVLDANGNPLGNVYVEIKPLTPNSWSHVAGYTEPSGYVSVFVTPDAEYSLSIYGSCAGFGNQPSYYQTFLAGTDPIALGNIVVGASNTASISGTITDCNGNPVTNGYLNLRTGDVNKRLYVNASGEYSSVEILCSATTDVVITAEDIIMAQESIPMPYTLVPGANTLGNIQACGVSSSQYLHYTINADTYAFTGPADFLSYSEYSSFGVASASSGNGGPGNDYINIYFSNAGIGVNTEQPLQSLQTPHFTDSITTLSSIPVHITEYGAIGEYVSGNFSGTVNGALPPNNTYNISGAFRLKRN